MVKVYQKWQKLFLFCFGLFVAAAFCMKWMENDLKFNGEKFTIIGLEISYSKLKVQSILSGLDPLVKSVLGYHLAFDFIFMPGVYGGIAALCMMARIKSESTILRKLLLVIAIAQLLAWGADITENCFLLSWRQNPVIGQEFEGYHLVVYVKWIIALAGAIISIPLVFRKRDLTYN